MLCRVFFFFFVSHFIADGPQHAINRLLTLPTATLPSCSMSVVIKDLGISCRFSSYDFLSRCKFSTLATRQPMVVFSFFVCIYLTYGR